MKDIYRGIGSIDFTAAARSAIMVDEDGLGRMIRHVKSNLAPMGPGLRYHLDDGRFRWGEEVQAYTETRGKTEIKVNKTPLVEERAKDLLFDILRDGPQPVAVILEVAKSRGISIRAMERAKGVMAHSRKVPGGWVWELSGREGMGDPAAADVPPVKVADPKLAALLEEARKRLLK